ncbi:MAG: ABC transporter ATP-binding protein [Xanthomonadales bacterium]|nr:ABC transporter ATP-binding protein [Gammaproteobacteria bacterium]NNE05273.1 ABC transporter ATP-binding protein [Xanthomonadales bacterium]NNL96555.1 ABC transporter ATP-binding protein [Xanthomonadales bacterium]
MTELACLNLDLSIGGKQVVSGLDFHPRPGEFWGLMGANGIGKTTLMKCLAGLQHPDRGSLRLGDTNLHKQARQDVARSIGMLQQHTVYVFEATVMQIALTGRHPHLGRWRQESDADFARARAALQAMEMETLAERNVTSLSGGEARRLAFATLLVQDTPIMLLDEPSNHLDLKYQVKIMSTIGNLVYTQKRLAIAAMHDINLAATYCSHVLMLFGDGAWAAGPAVEMFNRDQLERLYQCPVQMIQTPEGMRFHPSFRSDSS